MDYEITFTFLNLPYSLGRSLSWQHPLTLCQTPYLTQGTSSSLRYTLQNNHYRVIIHYWVHNTRLSQPILVASPRQSHVTQNGKTTNQRNSRGSAATPCRSHKTAPLKALLLCGWDGALDCGYLWFVWLNGVTPQDRAFRFGTYIRMASYPHRALLATSSTQTENHLLPPTKQKIICLLPTAYCLLPTADCRLPPTPTHKQI